MTKRWLLLIAASLVVCPCVILAASVWLLPEPQLSVSFVSRERFERIEEGMAEAEVQAILGQTGTLDGIRTRPGKTEPERWMIWQVDDREWAVMGFQNDRVSTGTSWRIYSREPSMVDKIRRWLSLG